MPTDESTTWQHTLEGILWAQLTLCTKMKNEMNRQDTRIPIHLNSYSDKTGGNITAWIVQVEQVFQAKNVMDGNKKIAIIGSYLQGTAQSCVLEYVQNFKNIFAQVFEMAEGDRIHYFLKGLKGRTKAEKNQHNWPDHLQNTPKGPTPMELDHIQQTDNPSNSKTWYRCYYCRKSGYFIKDCRKRQSDQKEKHAGTACKNSPEHSQANLMDQPGALGSYDHDHFQAKETLYLAKSMTAQTQSQSTLLVYLPVRIKGRLYTALVKKKKHLEIFDDHHPNDPGSPARH
ncbi:hypothetical protein K493DRAFT_297343 [Basidiobolus meristosporus CBS 931.73]|uniref:CCHC-type domain-containing protein n=1 Tax=Basidiobolus meristosporus CBS 931.73 TaxID=1314790 RepID=A0A1Y1Z1A1_9FUNG|nr:hypothetical protein K493DRAFT_297343 [Basidiobolus meristosporus CBS 931.73]|eukprot:ORY03727.1 hypothetical protein K493DRAFT_297343 [Basidiobolus meristosporus CBS 931.73]